MSLHLWHNLPTGPKSPDIIYAVIEVPKGSRNKYEYDKDLGTIRLDRVLYSPLHYPGDYGFIPQTYFEDGDPLDVLVMMQAATFPGCIIEARPIGVLRLIDEGTQDYKVLAVPNRDPNFGDYYDMDDIARHFPMEVEHFFTTYKHLEGKHTENQGWGNGAEARQTILDSVALYRAKFGTPDTE